MDKFIEQLPFFTPEHRTVASDMQAFVASEIEPRAAEERDTGRATARMRDRARPGSCAPLFSRHTRQEAGCTRAVFDPGGALVFFPARRYGLRHARAGHLRH